MFKSYMRAQSDAPWDVSPIVVQVADHWDAAEVEHDDMIAESHGAPILLKRMIKIDD